MKYVIGSGPAGVACATALLANDHEVTMLDVGIDLEEDRQEKVEILRQGPKDWTESAESRRIVEEMKADMLKTAGGQTTPKKLRYGSDFTYRGGDERLKVRRNGVGGSTSLAKGGFSNVWGASSLPFRREDIDEWPVNFDDLQTYYERAYGLLGLSAETDDLEQFFPLYHPDPDHLPRSNQAKHLMRQYESNRSELNDQGIYYGYSRLALDAEGEDACPHCGLEIFGCCPRGSVYDSTQTLDSLRERESFQYHSGVMVTGVTEDDETVTITAEEFRTENEIRYTGDRAFLACGVTSTTKLLMKSLEMHGESVKLLETPYFVLPMLMFDSPGDVTEERLNTLSQLYIELFDAEISDHTVHLQVYTYSDLYWELFRDALGPLFPVLSPVIGPVMNRFVAVMGYLHSDHMDGIDIRLTDQDELRISGQVSTETRQKIRAVVKKLRNNAFQTHLAPLSPWLEVKSPCESYHIGGTFPMSEIPGRYETDLLGRPSGMSRVHAVDSTVFPSIPATTITPSIMAMAYRIGDLAGGER